MRIKFDIDIRRIGVELQMVDSGDLMVYANDMEIVLFLLGTLKSKMLSILLGNWVF